MRDFDKLQFALADIERLETTAANRQAEIERLQAQVEELAELLRDAYPYVTNSRLSGGAALADRIRAELEGNNA